MAKDVIITPASGSIQFENSAGTEAGKIEQSGDDLVLSNAAGDILLGDGTADVYIGDGINNVDIIFEQNGSIKGETGAGVALTLGSSDTTLNITGSGTMHLNGAITASSLQIDNTTTFSGDLTVDGDINASGTISGSRIYGSGTNQKHLLMSTNTDAIAEIKPSDARSGLQSVILYRNQLNGVANYFMADGAITRFATYDGGTPSDVSGMVSIIPNNTNEAPKIAIGDADSGDARLTIGNNILLSNTGSIDSYINAGNVGIGTTSPTYKLDVNGTFRSNGIWTTSAAVTQWGNGTTAYGGLTWSTGYATVYSTTGNVLYLAANGTSPDVTIDTSGNVGIGTTAPSQKLDVVGNAVIGASGGGYKYYIKRPTDGSATTYFGYHSSDNSDFGISNASGGGGVSIKSNNGPFNFYNTSTSTSLFYITNGGSVGIGTTSPSASLHVFSSGNGEIEVERSAGALINLQAQSAKGVIGTDSNHPLSLKTNSGERLTIDTSGNVGIGTTSPTQKLRIFEGDIMIDSDYAMHFTSTADFTKIQRSNNALQFFTNSTRMLSLNDDGSGYFSGSGNFGIGTTSPSANLHSMAVNGSAFSLKLGRADNGSEWRFNHAGDDLRIYNTEGSGKDILLGVDAGGSDVGNKVGIGTAIPTEKLHVDGNVKVTGTIIAQEFHTEFVSASIIYESGSTKFGDTSDDTHDFTGSVRITGSARFTDSSGIYLGDSNDLQLYHNGSHSLISNQNGNLYIRQQTNDGLVYLQADDGSGGDTNYLTLDGSNTHAYFTNPGNVGIGTTSPSYKLHVDGGTIGSNLDSTGNNISRQVNMTSANTTGMNTFTVYNTNTDATPDFLGKYGYKLEGGTATANKHFQVYVSDSSNPRLVVNGSGNVGIGTTTPSAPLAFGKSVYAAPTSEDFFRIKLNDVGGINNDVGFGQPDSYSIGYNITPGGAHIFYGGTSGEIMRIQSNGNVGIGNTSPSYKLDVSGSARITTDNPVLQIADSDNTIRYAALELNTLGGRWYLSSGDSNAGAGVANSDLWITRNASGTDNRFRFHRDNYRFGIYSGSVQGIQLDATGDSYFNGGNVSIGTTTSLGKLTVIDNTNSATYQKFHVGRSLSSGLYITDTDPTSYIVAIQDENESGYGNLIIQADDSGSKDGYIALGHTTSGDKMTITSDGNVGIGTASPGPKLHTSGAGYFTGQTVLSQSLSLDYDYNNVGLIIDEEDYIYTKDNTSLRKLIGKTSDIIEIGQPGTALIDGIKLLPGTSNGYVSFHDSSTEYARFQSGSLGIGTTSPDSLLHVAADVSTGGVTSTGTIVIEGRPAGSLGDDIATIDFHNTGDKRADIRMERGNTATDSQLVFSTSDAGSLTDRMIINEAGNVGIGHSSPGASLDVLGHIRLNTVGNQLEFSNANVALQRGASNILELGGYGGIVFKASATTIDSQTERMRITDAGNVGIGTDSPGARLQVNGSTADTSANAVIVRNSSLTSLFSVRNDGRVDIPNGVLYTDEGISSSGSVESSDATNTSITSETARFNKFGLLANRSSMYITNENATGDMKFGIGAVHAGATKMTLTSAGRLGIGTTTPAKELEVNGGIRIGANETIESNGSITVVIDVNNNETDRTFTVAEGSANNALFTVGESGHITASGNISSSGDLISTNVTADSIILSSNGASSTPAIRRSTDTDTGIYFPATDNLALQAGGGAAEISINGTSGTTITGDTNIYGSITASGDLSLSGAITASAISSSETSSFGALLVGGATSLTEASTKLEVSGQINVGANGNTGIVRAYRGKFSRINNRSSGNDIIEFTTGNNISILGPITASSDISASGTIVASNLSGTNTGDQDLSSYIQNSQTSSMSVATASYALTASYVAGTVDVSGTPVQYQVAIFNDSNTILGDTGLTFNTSTDKLDANNGYTINDQPFGAYSAGQGMIFGDDTNVKNIYRAQGHLFTTPITASIISASGTGDNYFGGRIVQDNNKFITGTETGSTTRNILGIDSSNLVQVGNANLATTVKGASITLDGPTKTELKKSSTTDGDYYGTIIKLGSTATTVGKIYYWSGTAWALVGAGTQNAKKLIAVAISTNSSNGMLLNGTVTLDHDPGTAGNPLYLSTTSGEATDTAPSTPTYLVRLIGYCLDDTNGQIYFNPSNDWIELS